MLKVTTAGCKKRGAIGAPPVRKKQFRLNALLLAEQLTGEIREILRASGERRSTRDFEQPNSVATIFLSNGLDKKGGQQLDAIKTFGGKFNAVDGAFVMCEFGTADARNGCDFASFPLQLVLAMNAQPADAACGTCL